MSHSKILFGGPPGAGKTTAISAASDIALLDNAAVDHGTITLDDGNTLHLYGTPGPVSYTHLDVYKRQA